MEVRRKGLRRWNFREKKTLPEVHGGRKWSEEGDGGSEHFSDDNTEGGSEELEVEDEGEEGTRTVQPVALVGLGKQEANSQLVTRFSEEPVGLRQVEGGMLLELQMGTSEKVTEGKDAGLAGPAAVRQQQLSQEKRGVEGGDEARGDGDRHGPCSSNAREGDPPGCSKGLGGLGLRCSDVTESA